jgi:hypothetical protein
MKRLEDRANFETAVIALLLLNLSALIALLLRVGDLIDAHHGLLGG